MLAPPVPSFAVLGVVNEGKTSVVATLSEDPHVTPDPTPGATVNCEAFPIRIDGREVLRLYDTPGFQNSVRALAWFREQAKALPPGTDLLTLFRLTHAGDPNFVNECELFRPIVEENAGVLYVVDGSSPISQNYRAEMEMLWLSGRPRMALINHKDADDDYTAAWETELGKFFNLKRRFNAHRATQHDRLDLLRALQQIDSRPEWKAGFETAIAAFEQRWVQRRLDAVTAIVRMTGDCLGYVERANYEHEAEVPGLKVRLGTDYEKNVAAIERRAHERLLDIYSHPVTFETLDGLEVGLFHEATWQTLGLTRDQLVWAATAAGATAGLAIDALSGGHTLFVGTTVGGLLGGAGAFFGGKRLGEVTFELPGSGGPLGRLFPRGKLGGQQLQASCRNVDFVFVLLDRALLLYAALVNRAHARRDTIQVGAGSENALKGYTHGWSREARSVCLDFAASRRTGWRKLPFGRRSKEEIERAFFDGIDTALKRIGGQ